MNELRNFELGLWECRAPSSEDSVLDIARLLLDFGLLPAKVLRANGPERKPVDAAELEQFVRSQRYDMAARYPQWKPRRFSMTTEWAFPLVRKETPRAATMSVQILHPGIWKLGIIVGTLPSQRGGLSVEDFCEGWGGLLTDLGAALYTRCRPACAAITTFDARNESEWIDFNRAVSQRHLIIGWRTWFAPPYVDIFGKDWLLGLPDRTSELDDGGIMHQLDASATAMARAELSSLEALRSFLRQSSVHPAWFPGYQVPW